MHAMKIITVSLVSLLVGVGIGWYFGYTRSDAQAAKEVGSVLEAQESGAAVAAVFATEAVGCIDAGDTQKAVQFLSLPIAHYWVGYAIRAGTNSQRLKVRSYIEQSAYTNQIVAAQIKKEMSW
jgi:hypothetical protein